MEQARFCSILCGALLINVMLGMLMDFPCPSSFLSLFCPVRGSSVWAKSCRILWLCCHFHNFILCWLPGAYSWGYCFKPSHPGPSLFCRLRKGRTSVQRACFHFYLGSCILDLWSENVTLLFHEGWNSVFFPTFIEFLDSSSRPLFQLPGLQCLLGYFVCQTKTWPFMSSGRIFIIHQWNYLWRRLCSQSSVGRTFECPLWVREKIST